MNLLELREQEDNTIKEIETWARSKQLLIYELLNRRHNCTMSNIEHARVEAWKKEHNEKPG